MFRFPRYFRQMPVLATLLTQRQAVHASDTSSPSIGDDATFDGPTATETIEANYVPETFLGPRRTYLRQKRLSTFGEWVCTECSHQNCGDRLDCLECGAPASPPNVAKATPPHEQEEENQATSNGPPEEEETIRRELNIPRGGVSRGGVWRPSRGAGPNSGGRGRGTTSSDASATPSTSTAPFTPSRGRGSRPTAEGSWACPCGGTNFHYRFTCFKCGAKKPQPS